MIWRDLTLIAIGIILALTLPAKAQKTTPHVIEMLSLVQSGGQFRPIRGFTFSFPSLEICMDNAAVIMEKYDINFLPDCTPEEEDDE